MNSSSFSRFCSNFINLTSTLSKPPLQSTTISNSNMQLKPLLLSVVVPLALAFPATSDQIKNCTVIHLGSKPPTTLMNRAVDETKKWLATTVYNAEQCVLQIDADTDARLKAAYDKIQAAILELRKGESQWGDGSRARLTSALNNFVKLSLKDSETFNQSSAEEQDNLLEVVRDVFVTTMEAQLKQLQQQMNRNKQKKQLKLLWML
jgi:hypothetical protein